MHVALVGDRPPPHGGISVHVESLGRALRARGLEVSFIDTRSGASPARVAQALVLGGARGRVLHVHTSGHNLKSWLLALAGGVAGGVLRRSVITLHSGLLTGYLEGMPGRARLARLALGGYGRTVVVNAGLAATLGELGVRRVTVLPAFSSSSLEVGRVPAGFEGIRDAHAVLLACALAPSPIYGARTLWAALGLLRRSLPTLGCAVFGPGTAALAGEVRAAGLEGAVALLGELTHPQALAVMSRCDAFLRPTLVDGDALSVREALGLGIPVVASDVVPRPRGTRLFRSGDPFHLDEAVRAALSLPRPAAEEVDAVSTLVDIYRGLVGLADRSAQCAG